MQHAVFIVRISRRIRHKKQCDTGTNKNNGPELRLGNPTALRARVQKYLKSRANFSFLALARAKLRYVLLFCALNLKRAYVPYSYFSSSTFLLINFGIRNPITKRWSRLCKKYCVMVEMIVRFY